MKFLPHDLRQMKTKILWLDSKKKCYFLVSWMNTTNIATLSVFLAKKCLGLLEVKIGVSTLHEIVLKNFHTPKKHCRDVFI